MPVGTSERVSEVVRSETTHPFSVVSNPEFLKQGAAVEDFMKPDRVVIGAEDPRAEELMRELYGPFTRTGAPIMVMDRASAELSKYAARGLSFKPNTDDMREAPSVPFTEGLRGAGARVQAYDPEAIRTARDIFGSRITFASGNYEALKGADCLAIVTEWNEFRRPDFLRMRKLMRDAVVFDGRILYTPGQMQQHGFTYFSIGRA